MKHAVMITFSIDPTEYDGVEDTPRGAVALAAELLKGNTDWPDEGLLHITCQEGSYRMTTGFRLPDLEQISAEKSKL